MPAPDLRFRAATLADLPRIRQLAEETWRVCYPGIISPEQIDYMLDWMYSTRSLTKDLADPTFWFGIMELEDADPIGYAAFSPGESAGECHLHKFYLHPDFHGRGLGSAALHQLLDRARGQGYASISLRVNRANEAGIRCYRKAGFTIEREICSDIGNGFLMDDYWMVRQLS